MVHPSSNSSNTLIFTDSIAKGIRMYEFNRFIKNSKAKMFNFLGASSHQMLHYLDVHLEDRQINAVVIHVRINDILRDSSQSSIDGLLQNIKNLSLKCKKFGVKNIFISGLVYTTRINIGILEKNHVMIQNFCQEYGWFYVDNRNIRGKHLCKDGLHLMEEGKIILAKHTSFNCQDLKENLSEETGLQQLQGDRLKHRKNPLIGYLIYLFIYLFASFKVN